MRLVIISGRSGSGKTIALHVLEDLGFYCIDNLPIALIPELKTQLGDHHEVAVSIDARNIPNDLKQFKKIIEDFKKQGNSCEIIYLDANENTLLKRFSETRRKHPLTSDSLSLREAIQHEHALLTPIASLADLTINSSNLNRQSLQTLIRDRIKHHRGGRSLQVLLQSFGFKHGLPSDADFIFDVRCLPNPYWETALRTFSGKDKVVKEYLIKEPAVLQMIEDIHDFLKKWVPKFEADNRSYMTIALGCTGGQHRSVFMVEHLAKKLQAFAPELQIRHRDIAT